jgi:hypothetical protein
MTAAICKPELVSGYMLHGCNINPVALIPTIYHACNTWQIEHSLLF